MVVVVAAVVVQVVLVSVVVVGVVAVVVVVLGGVAVDRDPICLQQLQQPHRLLLPLLFREKNPRTVLLILGNL